MLEITIPATEYWDEKNNIFIYSKEQTLRLEHSLVSISKWESKWKKPFLSKQEKTLEETIDYIKCMTLTQNVDPTIYNGITRVHLEEIRKYIEDPMTATIFSGELKSGGGNEMITSELVYYWMTSLNIPSEYQKWHFNRLMTLIKVCNAKNQPAKKMSKRDILSKNAALNAARKQQLNTSG